MLVIPDKFQILPFLFPCDRLSCDTVVHHDSAQMKFKWIPAYQIIVHRHLESRSDHAPDCLDGAVALPIRLKLNQPLLRIR